MSRRIGYNIGNEASRRQIGDENGFVEMGPRWTGAYTTGRCVASGSDADDHWSPAEEEDTLYKTHKHD